MAEKFKSDGWKCSATHDDGIIRVKRTGTFTVELEFASALEADAYFLGISGGN